MWAELAKAFAEKILKDKLIAQAQGYTVGDSANIKLVAQMLGIGSGDGKTETADTKNMGKVAVAPADYYKSAGAQESGGIMSKMKGVLDTNQGQGQADQGNKVQSSGKTKIIPTQTQPSMEEIQNIMQQYVPGPNGSVVGGQGEVAPGFGMQSPQSRIPTQYMDMAKLVQQRPLQQQSFAQQTPPMIPSQYQGMVNRLPIQGQPMQQPQQPAQQPLTPGAFAGLKEGILGMPSTGMGANYTGQEGRQTAYYAGKMIPDIFRSRLGVNTTGEEAIQQQRMESTGGKKSTPEYKADLEQSITRLPQLDEKGKILLYQKLAVQYPERSAELKRIFFPQSQDNNEALMALIASGMNR